MTVTEAIRTIRSVGTLTAEGDRLRYSVPRARRPEVEPALATLQAQKADALRLLCGQTEPESLETVLKGLAIELWTNGESFWLVADETDAARLSEPRGRVFTAAEARLMVRIADPAIVAEVREWKRRFDGRWHEVSAGHSHLRACVVWGSNLMKKQVLLSADTLAGHTRTHPGPGCRAEIRGRNYTADLGGGSVA